MKFAVAAMAFAVLLPAQDPKPAPAPRMPTRMLQEVRTVLVAPMGSAFDQYLANQLAAKGVVQVVTDPNKADAYLIDRISPFLKERAEEMGRRAPDTDKKKDEEAWTKPNLAGFTRSRGNFFLVDAQTYDVIWSIFAPPKSAMPGDLIRTAGQIADKLKEARKVK
ncbi:MAG: hypothetical protein K2X35_15985 [Bryobacteraceae bacterium]|nr:hypothetical protein [Bryobacteraceae bacterium]